MAAADPQPLSALTDPGFLTGILCEIDDTLTHDGRLVPGVLHALHRLQEAGLKVVPVTTAPAEDATINIVYHWQHRNNPNGGTAEAAHAYLDWEIGLVDQLDEQERASFRLAPL